MSFYGFVQRVLDRFDDAFQLERDGGLLRPIDAEVSSPVCSGVFLNLTCEVNGLVQFKGGVVIG